VPRAEVRVLDTWRSSGLRATGSHQVDIPLTSVPAHRLWSATDDLASPGPYGWVEYGRPSYRLTLWMFAESIVAPALAGALGALDAFAEKYTGTGPRPGAMRHAGQGTLQVAYAESRAEVEAALALWRGQFERNLRRAAEGYQFTLEERTAVRRNQAYASRLAARAVTRLYESTGAHALDERDPLQRAFRDVHAANHHIAIPFEATLAPYGQVALGLPPDFDLLRDGIDPALIADETAAKGAFLCLIWPKGSPPIGKRRAPTMPRQPSRTRSR
jgi:3-hydroxy-9,10-secoandrosta-1,3,5(10)-triene-9,17-dione monooxygenase